MVLIIVEKPDEMRKIINAVDGKNAKHIDGHYESDENIYTSCFGHLLEQMMPKEIDEKYSKWSLSLLPLTFDEIPLKVKANCKDQFKLIKKLVADKRVTEIVNACDADREGELIFWNLFELIKMPKSVKVSRMWITEQTPEGLKNAFVNRQDDGLYDNLRQAAKCRSHADYFVGLGGTMGMTSKNHGTLFTVGRVQTPTLRMIVDLERKIQDFKPETFYRISALLKENDIVGDWFSSDYKNGRINDLKVAETIVKKVGIGDASVTKSESKTKKESCKTLHSLSSLQIEMNKRYGYSAQLVLDTCQSLYEKHNLTTYPRTDENTISAGMATKAVEIVKNLPVYKEICDKIIENGYKVNSNCISNSSDIGAHEALTPVLGKIKLSTIEGLSNIEKNVFNEITERFLQSFFPDAVYEIQNIEFTRNGETFKTTNKAVVKLGYLEVTNKKVASDILAPLKKGDIVHITSVRVAKGETQPPARFNEGSLMAAMVNPIEYVESKEDKAILKEVEGIGTEATRAGIIEQLKKQGFIKIEKKTIFPTEKAFFEIDNIPSELIKSVKLTAEFEKKLKLIALGKYDSETFEKEIKKMMTEFIEVLKMQNQSNYDSSKDNEFCTCPHCGKTIIKNDKGYFCVDKNCGVKLYNTALEKALGYKKITDTQAKELLTKGKTSKPAKLVSKKSGKEYEAYLTYKFDESAQYPNNVWIELKSNR